jgi:hypothetical protein
MGGPCTNCDRVCTDTFEECVESSLSWDEIRMEQYLEERRGMPTVWTTTDENTNDLTREPEWKDKLRRDGGLL